MKIVCFPYRIIITRMKKFVRIIYSRHYFLQNRIFRVSVDSVILLFMKLPVFSLVTTSSPCILCFLYQMPFSIISMLKIAKFHSFLSCGRPHLLQPPELFDFYLNMLSVSHEERVMYKMDTGSIL